MLLGKLVYQFSTHFQQIAHIWCTCMYAIRRCCCSWFTIVVCSYNSISAYRLSHSQSCYVLCASKTLLTHVENHFALVIREWSARDASNPCHLRMCTAAFEFDWLWGNGHRGSTFLLQNVVTTSADAACYCCCCWCFWLNRCMHSTAHRHTRTVAFEHDHWQV